MSDPLRTTTLLAAAITLGLMAGLFFGFANAVMPGLRRTDDRTFVAAMQRFNASIQNGLFALVFLGALVATGWAAWLHRGDRPVFLPVLIALGLYVVTLLITFGVNIPLNNRLDAAGDPQRVADPRAVRKAFYGPWVRWNALRTLTCMGAFGSICWALVRHSAS